MKLNTIVLMMAMLGSWWHVASARTPAQSGSVALGFRFFGDTRFSRNKNVSCGTCHVPQLLFGDGKPLAEGVGRSTRHTPTLVNLSRQTWFMWDGRAPSLEHQAGMPIENPVEHGFSRGGVAWVIYHHYRNEWQRSKRSFPPELANWLASRALEDVHALPEPARPFVTDPMLREAISTLQDTEFLRMIFAESQKRGSLMQTALLDLYGGTDQLPKKWTDRWKLLPPGVAKDIDKVFQQFATDLAAFVRTIQIDKSKGLRRAQLSSSALRGKDLFEGKAGCVTCHRGDEFTDHQFHNTGLPAVRPLAADNLPDLGRAMGVGAYLSTQPQSSKLCEKSTSKACREAPFLSAFATESVGAFKTPSLWNVSRTAPYMHDGSLASLDEVLAFYNQLPTRAVVGRRTGVMRSLGFSPDELADLKSFLESLVVPVTYDEGVNHHEIK